MTNLCMEDSASRIQHARLVRVLYYTAETFKPENSSGTAGFEPAPSDCESKAEATRQYICIYIYVYGYIVSDIYIYGCTRDTGLVSIYIYVYTPIKQIHGTYI